MQRVFSYSPEETFDIKLRLGLSKANVTAFIEAISGFCSNGRQIRSGVVVRASALLSVDLGFIPFVESYRKTFKNGICSFPAWRSAFMGGCGEQAGKLACCVLGQGT